MALHRQPASSKACVTSVLRLAVQHWLQAAICAAITVILTGSSAVAAPIKAFRLKQETSSNGIYEVLICDRGVKLKSISYQFEVVSRPPKWEVYAFRTQTREFASSTLAYWKKFLMPSFQMFGATADFITPSNVEPYRWQNHAMIKYTFFPTDKKPVKSYWLSNAEPLALHHFELRSFDLKVPEEASAVAYRIYNLPPLKGAPYSLISIEKNGSRGFTLKTLEWKEEQLKDDKVFTAPTHYRNRGLITGSFLTETIRGLGGDASELLEIQH